MRSPKSTLRKVLQFDALTAVKSDGYYTRDLFSVENLAGVWRRIPRSSQSLSKKKPGAVLGLFGDQLVELVRDDEVETELARAGFPKPPPYEPTLFDQLPDPPDEATAEQGSVDGQAASQPVPAKT